MKNISAPLSVFSQNCIVGTAPRLQPGQSGVWFPAMARGFSLHRNVKTSCGAHQASYSMDIKGSFLGTKAAGVW